MRTLERPRSRRRLGALRSAVDAQVAHRDHDVDREEHDRDGDRDEEERVALPIAAAQGTRRNREQRYRAEHGEQLPAQRARVDLAVAACDHRRTEDEEDVRDDEP